LSKNAAEILVFGGAPQLVFCGWFYGGKQPVFLTRAADQQADNRRPKSQSVDNRRIHRLWIWAMALPWRC